MPHANHIQVSAGFVRVVQLAELQNSDAWKRAFQNKCKDHRYYEIVEETLECEFEHHYLLLEDASGSVRAVQPMFFVRQNLVEGVPGKIRSVVDAIRKMVPHFLTMRVLMLAAERAQVIWEYATQKTSNGWQMHCRQVLEATPRETKLRWSFSRISRRTIVQPSEH